MRFIHHKKTLCIHKRLQIFHVYRYIRKFHVTSNYKSTIHIKHSIHLMDEHDPQFIVYCTLDKFHTRWLLLSAYLIRKNKTYRFAFKDKKNTLSFGSKLTLTITKEWCLIPSQVFISIRILNTETLKYVSRFHLFFYIYPPPLNSWKGLKLIILISSSVNFHFEGLTSWDILE